MLQNFFRLNEPFIMAGSEEFDAMLREGSRVSDLEYVPDTLESRTIKIIRFENVSFSKTRIYRVTFQNCTFTDCLFIGTHFESVELHGCEFRDCNFFKATLRNVYGRPQQFRDAIREAKYANIAVHLYQQLRENYSAEAQREFKNEAEYGFAKWRRRNNILQARRQNRPISHYIVGHTISWLYDALFGYGYRLRNLLFTTAGLLTIACVSNYYLTPRFFSQPTHPSWLKTVYFTVTTMCTLGAAGYNPDTEFGYFFVLLNLLVGITILSTALSAMLKKLAR